MTEVWRLDHRARKRIKEVKKKARPGKENGMRFITYATLRSCKSYDDIGFLHFPFHVSFMRSKSLTPKSRDTKIIKTLIHRLRTIISRKAMRKNY